MKKQRCILCVITFFLFQGCTNFLDKNPQMSLVIPSTLDDLQSILDDYDNLAMDPTVGEISADDYFLIDNDWRSLSSEGHRRTYTWEKDYLFGTSTASDWLNVYRNVYAANTVLEKITNIPRNERNNQEWDNVKGQAFFLRARSFLSIAAIWVLSYDGINSNETLGIPLRLESDFNIPSYRSTLEQTYKTILGDLEQAILLLPERGIHVSRASKAAAFALRARTALFMREYETCYFSANECLKIKNDLMDYNSLDPQPTYPVSQFNKEVIYVSYIATPQPINPSRAKVDSLLYKQYDSRDLRRTIFFRDNKNGTFSFKGSYQGNITLFSGLATDEVYLMRAECNLRLGRINDALKDINVLLKSRWNNHYEFKPVEITDPTELLNLILLERRKSLLMRGIRWPDVKRLNKEGRNISMARTIQGIHAVLEANDLRFALPIPEQIIELSGMEQNPR